MAENVWDKLWSLVRVHSGTCASNIQLKELNDYLEKGEQYTNQAAMMSYFVGLNPKSVEKLKVAAKAIGKIRDTISTITDICLDINAITQIHDAIKILNDPAINKPGSREAALAYGQLFVGVGHFAAKLPPPANAYAKILKACGSFFADIQSKLDPDKRWKDQFDQVEGYRHN